MKWFEKLIPARTLLFNRMSRRTELVAIKMRGDLPDEAAARAMAVLNSRLNLFPQTPWEQALSSVVSMIELGAGAQLRSAYLRAKLRLLACSRSVRSGPRYHAWNRKSSAHLDAL